MAYPFTQAPAVSEFIAKALEEGAELNQQEGVIGPRGPVQIQYLKRVEDGRTHFTAPLPTDLTERLNPETVRRFCKQLHLDPRLFGLHLG